MQMSQARLFEYFRSNHLLVLPWASSKFASCHKLPNFWSLPFPAIALKYQSALYGHANILGANRVEGKQMVRGDLLWVSYFNLDTKLAMPCVSLCDKHKSSSGGSQKHCSLHWVLPRRHPSSSRRSPFPAVCLFSPVLCTLAVLSSLEGLGSTEHLGAWTPHILGVHRAGLLLGLGSKWVLEN